MAVTKSTKANATVSKAGKFTLPSNLSFRRSIDVSDGLLSSVMPDGTLLPVIVEQVTVRGAMGMSTAGYSKSGKPLSLDETAKAQNPTTPNIQTIDRASLNAGSDTLDLSFSMAFHNGGGKPDACGKDTYRAALAEFMVAACTSCLYVDLAARYLWNIVNGRVLWRNNYGIAAGCTLTTDMGVATFEWGSLRQRDTFPGVAALAAACAPGSLTVEILIARIAGALSGAQGLFAINVSLRSASYKGAEVWPSQEFVEKTQTLRNRREISRILAHRTVKVDNAAVWQGVMHSQKIGNAIRTVDEWHGDVNFGAIPVEAFGWVQSELAATRAPAKDGSGLDAYRSLESVAKTAAGLLEDAVGARELGLYTLALIIRGGVFGVSEKEEKVKAEVVSSEDEVGE